MLSRRTFLVATGGALAAPRLALARQQEEVPPLLDHILLGSRDLQLGIAFLEQRTGVRAAFGGVHPGRGTQNALLSLGTSRYLEIIAPDPQQHTENPLAKKLQSLPEPRLVGWAVHPGSDIESLAAKLKSEGIVAEGPTPGSRRRPDGRELRWQTLNLKDEAQGLLPFFIQWAGASVHPSIDAPAGLRLVRFELITPDPVALGAATAKLSLDAPIIKGEAPKLRAIVAGPKSQLTLSS